MRKTEEMEWSEWRHSSGILFMKFDKLWKDFRASQVALQRNTPHLSWGTGRRKTSVSGRVPAEHSSSGLRLLLLGGSGFRARSSGTRLIRDPSRGTPSGGFQVAFHRKHASSVAPVYRLDGRFQVAFHRNTPHQ